MAQETERPRLQKMALYFPGSWVISDGRGEYDFPASWTAYPKTSSQVQKNNIYILYYILYQDPSLEVKVCPLTTRGSWYMLYME